MWFEKMMRTISRGLSDIEELERVETEKTVRVEKVNRSLVEGPFVAMYKFIGIKGRRYSSP